MTETAQARARRLVEEALLREYPWHKYDGWGGEDAPEGSWPHLSHVAEVVVAAMQKDGWHRG